MSTIMMGDVSAKKQFSGLRNMLSPAELLHGVHALHLKQTPAMPGVEQWLPVAVKRTRLQSKLRA